MKQQDAQWARLRAKQEALLAEALIFIESLQDQGGAVCKLVQDWIQKQRENGLLLSEEATAKLLEGKLRRIG